MNYKDNVNSRFIECCEFLIQQKFVANKTALSAKLEIKSNKLSEILSNRMRAGVAEIQKLCSEYDISYEYLFIGKGNMLIDHNSNVGVVTKTTEETLFAILKEKDAKIEAQAIQIGRLESEVEILRKKSPDREDAVDVECVGAVG